MAASHDELITGMVLAGGASQRMQRVVSDKGLLPWQGKPMVHYVLERLRPQVDQVVINANRHIAEYQKLGVPVWTDERDADWEDFPGPLAGMLTGLRQCTTPWLVTVPCDAPLLHPQLVRRLYESALHNNAQIAFACTTSDSQPDQCKDHPVFALLHRSLESQLYHYLQAGERKVQHWMMQQAYTRVCFDDDKLAFMVNINTKAGFADFCELTHTMYPL